MSVFSIRVLPSQQWPANFPRVCLFLPGFLVTHQRAFAPSPPDARLPQATTWHFTRLNGDSASKKLTIDAHEQFVRSFP